MSFSSSTNIQFTIWEQFLQSKACKSVEIDSIGIEVAQQIKLSGCPIKGLFTDKKAFLPLLTEEWPFFRQPVNVIFSATSMPMTSIFTNLHAQMVNWILVELKNDILYSFLVFQKEISPLKFSLAFI